MMPVIPDEKTLSDRMRQGGLRVTRPRLVLLGLLHRLGGHRSAEELLDALNSDGPSLPRASVYNVLNDLLAHGLIMLADAGPGRALYEASTHWHHHFVCRECGHVADVPCMEGSKPCMQPGVKGLEVDEAQVIFRGRCPFTAAAPAIGPKPSACCH